MKILIVLVLVAFLVVLFHTRNRRIPKILWSYWHDDTQPEIVQKCVESWRKYNPDWEINVLSDATVEYYLPDFNHALFNGSLKQYKSDLIRLMIVERYGGVWSDATVAVRESYDWITDRREEFVGYYREAMKNESGYPIIESFLYGAPPGCEFVSRWRQEFEIASEMGNDRYVERDDVDSSGIHDQGYLAVYVAAQVVLQHYYTWYDIAHRFYLRKVEDGPYKHAASANWNNVDSLKWICERKPEELPPIIKMYKEQRQAIDDSNLHCVYKMFN